MEIFAADGDDVSVIFLLTLIIYLSVFYCVLYDSIDACIRVSTLSFFPKGLERPSKRWPPHSPTMAVHVLNATEILLIVIHLSLSVRNRTP